MYRIFSSSKVRRRNRYTYREDSLNTQFDGENVDSKGPAAQIEIRLSSDSGKESAVICGLNEQKRRSMEPYNGIL